MRFLVAAVLLVLALQAGMAAVANAQTNSSGSAAAPPKPAAQLTPPAAESSADSEAAARHAKRTACLKQARVKKLVGAQRNAFVKECVGVS